VSRVVGRTCASFALASTRLRTRAKSIAQTCRCASIREQASARKSARARFDPGECEKQALRSRCPGATRVLVRAFVCTRSIMLAQQGLVVRGVGCQYHVRVERSILQACRSRAERARRVSCGQQQRCSQQACCGVNDHWATGPAMSRGHRPPFSRRREGRSQLTWSGAGLLAGSGRRSALEGRENGAGGTLEKDCCHYIAKVKLSPF
jgi:hypothetical protein